MYKEDESIVRHLINEIELFLKNSGDSGKWMLNKIEEAIEIGLEDEEKDDNQRDLFGYPVRKSSVDKKGIVYRAPMNPLETLEMYIGTMEAYTVHLPACFETAKEIMKKDFFVNSVQISLLMENVPDTYDKKASYHPPEMFTDHWKQNVKTFRKVLKIIQELKAGENNDYNG